MRYLIGSVYTKPTGTDTKGLKKLLDHITEVRKYRKKHNFNSILIYGDFNARNEEWGDHVTNSRGKVLECNKTAQSLSSEARSLHIYTLVIRSHTEKHSYIILT